MCFCSRRISGFVAQGDVGDHRGYPWVFNVAISDLWAFGAVMRLGSSQQWSHASAAEWRESHGVVRAREQWIMTVLTASLSAVRRRCYGDVRFVEHHESMSREHPHSRAVHEGG